MNINVREVKINSALCIRINNPNMTEVGISKADFISPVTLTIKKADT